jgi:hypothetical protein
MNRFDSLDSLAKSFIRAYYTMNVYHLVSLPNFYAAGSIISRNGHTFSYFPNRGPSAVSLILANESTLTIIRYTSLQVGKTAIISVEGMIETQVSSSGFSQTFILIEMKNKIWIKGDFLTQVEEHFFEILKSGEFYELERGKTEIVRKPKNPRPPPKQRTEIEKGKGNRFLWEADFETG